MTRKKMPKKRAKPSAPKKSRRKPRPVEQPLFWLLWCPTSKHPPRIRQSSQKAAEHAAQDMANRHKAEFIVLQAVSGFKPRVSVDLTSFTGKPVPPQRAGSKMYDTFEGWRLRGRGVRKGQRALARTTDGKPLFKQDQTKPWPMHLPRESDVDFDREMDFELADFYGISPWGNS